MVVGPRAVRGDLVGCYPATEAIKVGKRGIVDLLEVALDEAFGNLLPVVEL